MKWFSSRNVCRFYQHCRHQFLIFFFFALHQLRVKKDEKDELYFQQQIILRNSTSFLQVISRFLKTNWAWKTQRFKRLTSRKLKFKTFFIFVSFFLIFIDFTIVDIFVDDMIKSAYKSDYLKIYSINCDHLEMNIDIFENLSTLNQRSSKNLQTIKIYIKECYQTITMLTACDVYF